MWIEPCKKCKCDVIPVYANNTKFSGSAMCPKCGAMYPICPDEKMVEVWNRENKGQDK